MGIVAEDNNACLEAIRRRAKETWMQPLDNPTSYSNDFKYKILHERTTSKPSSPTRLNKPHPKLFVYGFDVVYVEY